MYQVYGKPDCPDCVKLKSFMMEKGVEFDYIDILIYEESLQKLKSLGARSVPQVFKIASNGFETHIGGYKEALEYIKERT